MLQLQLIEREREREEENSGDRETNEEGGEERKKKKKNKLKQTSVEYNGLYLLDDGRYMYLYIGSELPAEVLSEVFNVSGDGKAGQYRIKHLPNQPAHISSRINVLIGTLRKNKPNFQNLQIISRRAAMPSGPPAGSLMAPSGGPAPSPGNRASWEQFESLDENLFFSHLIEDAVQPKQGDLNAKNKKDPAGGKLPNQMSYIDFLCFIHKRIQAKFCQLSAIAKQ